MPRKKLSQEQIKRSLEARDFYSDYHKDNMLYAAFVRSPVAAGYIKSIVLDDIPDGYYLFTANDIPASKKFEINKIPIKLFGYGEVTYRGEPIGIVAGPDESKVAELVDKVSVNFDIASLESALKKVMTAPRRKQQDFVHPQGSLPAGNYIPHIQGIGGTKKPLLPQEETNELSSFVSQINELPSLDEVFSRRREAQWSEETIAQREVKTGFFKDHTAEEIEEELFSDSLIVTEEEWRQEVIAPNWKETAGACCTMEGKKLHVYTPTQWTYNVIQVISQTIGLQPENIIIHKTKTSGIFMKGLWRNSVIAAQVALVSFLTKKTVKLVLSQAEQDSYMKIGVKTTAKYRTSTQRDGLLKAVYADIEFDVGVANPFAQEIADRMSIVACNFYKPQNIHITVKAHTSKNPPTSMCIKSADSQILFAIENQIQEICSQKKFLPQEFLKDNLQSPSPDFPFLIDSLSTKKVLDNTIKISDFNRKFIAFQMDAIDRVPKNSNPFFALPLRGVGITTSFNISDYYGSDLFLTDNRLEVTLLDNDKVEIHTIRASEIIQDIWKSTASQILQLPKENIQINSDYTLEEIPRSPENINGTLGITNELIKKCCNEIQKKRFHQPLPIASKKGIAASTRKLWHKDTFSGVPFANMSYAATAVEVELDTYTYNERIKGIWITADCGEIYDEAAVTRTIRLEVQQELSMLVRGKTVPCDSITIQFIKSKNKAGQVSGLVHNTLPAAFASALSLALATQLTKLPCTEKRLFDLIKERETEDATKEKPDKKAPQTEESRLDSQTEETK